MRKVFDFFQDVIKSCNVFVAPVNLRYNLDPDYNTFTGGMVSIGLIILLVSVFYNAWLQVLNKEAISSSKQIVRQFEPEYMEVNSDQFMFAIGINGLNLTDAREKQYFKLDMKKYMIINSPVYERNSTTFTLEPCTAQHWQQLGPQFVQTFQRQKLSSFLCVPRNTTIQLAGKYTSQQFIYYKIEFTKCRGLNCRTQEQINSWISANTSFSFNFYYSNTLINPDQKEPLSMFFEDKDYTMFSTKMATSTNLYVGEYVMETDESIFPWTDTQTHEGFIVNREEKQAWNYIPTPTQAYCKLYLRKSNQRFEIDRKFRKIDDMLSYIGGLFGIIAVAFGFVMNYYSQCCFELEMCQNFFDYHNKKKNKTNKMDDNGQSQENSAIQMNTRNVNPSYQDDSKSQQNEQQQKIIEPQHFGFLDFLMHIIYIPLNKICGLKWRRMQIYQESLEEMRYKLDISQLLEKLAFYDRSLNALFDDSQLKLLYLQEKFNFEEVREQREMLSMRKDIVANLIGMVNGDIMSKEDQPFQCKKTLKQIAQGHSRKRLKTFIGHSAKITDLFNPGAKVSPETFGEINLPPDIKAALKILDQKIQNNDPTSIRIYNGLQYELLSAYEKSKMKKTKDYPTGYDQRKQYNILPSLKKIRRKQKPFKTTFADEHSPNSIMNFVMT